MRLTLSAIIVFSFATAAHAQPVAPASAPDANSSAPAPVTPVAPDQAQPGAVPAADGVIHQWGPAAPIVQAAPAPAQSYPACTRERQDSCYNPDPRKEADSKAADRADG